MILKLPLLFPAIDAYRGRTMSEVARAEGLDVAWSAAGAPGARAAREEDEFLTAFLVELLRPRVDE